MHYATAMCSLKSFADFDSVFQDPFDWRGPLRKRSAKVSPSRYSITR
jgi:hypothetical protein